MYDQIARNKRDSIVLMVVLFAILAGLGCAVAGAESLPWETGVAIAACVWVGATLTAWYGGSAMVLAVSGAQRIAHDDNPQLFNVVEEMAIAAGLPMPAVYILHDSAPNAFATGRSPGNAAIAVTTGLLEKLNRDELQGVVAHEMSHIRNLDTRILMLLGIIVGGIVLFCDVFRRSSRWGLFTRRGRNQGPAALPLLVLAIVLAILAPIFARLLEMAVSRKREYLADASAALLTRYPDGLASALQKIASDPEPLEAANRATQHLYIVNPLKAASASGGGLFDTHPPIEDRIARLRAMGLHGSEQAAPPAGGIAAAPASAPAGTMGLIGGGAPAAARTTARHAAPKCPRCQANLLAGRIRGRSILGCRQCGGLWMAAPDVEALLHDAPQDLDAADRHFPNLVGHGWDNISKRACPQCAAPLVPHTLGESLAVSLDRCPACNGIWFDDGELTALALASHSA